jgi:hypothetical protein
VVDGLLDSIARGLRDDRRVMELLADAKRVTADDLEAAVALVMLRLRQGHVGDDAVLVAVGRAGLEHAWAEALGASHRRAAHASVRAKAAVARAETIQQQSRAVRQESAAAVADLRAARQRIAEQRRAVCALEPTPDG